MSQAQPIFNHVIWIRNVAQGGGGGLLITSDTTEQTLNKYNFKEGDSVRLIDSKSVGIIEKLEKNKVIINYGSFKTKTTTDELEIV